MKILGKHQREDREVQKPLGQTYNKPHRYPYSQLRESLSGKEIAKTEYYCRGFGFSEDTKQDIETQRRSSF